MNHWTIPGFLAFAILNLAMQQPATAADSFDGVYKGGMTATKSKNPSNYVCKDIAGTTYVVANNKLVSPVGNSSLKFEGNVAADGSFKTTLTWGSPPDTRTLEGTIQGKKLTGKFESGYCVFAVEADKQ